jgi:molybdopterin-biosynthesis enzyme MoeA-like protein
MMDSVVPQLRTGAVVISRTVRVEGAGEGVIAEPLAAIAKAHPDLSLGSYPFFGQQGYGSNLVVRGRDAAAVEDVVAKLIEALSGIGAQSITRVEP